MRSQQSYFTRHSPGQSRFDEDGAESRPSISLFLSFHRHLPCVQHATDQHDSASWPPAEQTSWLRGRAGTDQIRRQNEPSRPRGSLMHTCTSGPRCVLDAIPLPAAAYTAVVHPYLRCSCSAYMTLRTDSSYTASNTCLESAASALQCSHQFQHRSHPNAMIGQSSYPGCANRRALTSLSGLIVTVKLFVIT